MSHSNISLFPVFYQYTCGSHGFPFPGSMCNSELYTDIMKCLLYCISNGRRNRELTLSALFSHSVAVRDGILLHPSASCPLPLACFTKLIEFDIRLIKIVQALKRKPSSQGRLVGTPVRSISADSSAIRSFNGAKLPERRPTRDPQPHREVTRRVRHDRR